jgi:hypothetical protein
MATFDLCIGFTWDDARREISGFKLRHEIIELSC